MARAKKSTSEAKRARAAPPDAGLLPVPLAGRYHVRALLGRGGTASVYRGFDVQGGRELAIKQAHTRTDSRDGREARALFEREFQLLSQLSHPRVIEVYDFGIEDGRPYYTMELLEGGDLRELSPLPWQRVCALMYDVCSSLALLHSRRLVHRDVSPRNVRCSRAGDAKLIDFGAAVAMGIAAHVVGTPAFVAPEALGRGPLDARTDLFGLGATCYFALTGRPPFQAQHLPELSAAWSNEPYRASQLVADIPPALDELLMSMISLDPAQRPRSAFEVMQRLSSIVELPRSEPYDVPRAYLSAPASVGRDRELAKLGNKLSALAAAHGGGSATLIAALSGGGRSHLLGAAALMGKTQGACVLRCAADSNGQPFTVAQALLTQLCEHIPQTLRACAPVDSLQLLLSAPPAQGEALAPRTLDDTHRPALVRDALARLLWSVARERPLAVIVDDVDELDETDLALLTALAQAGNQPRICLLMAADEDALRARNTLQVLAGYCELLPLAPLDQPATTQLVSSLFGDVPNLALISHEIYQRAHGNPGATLWSAQWLVERGVVGYEAGAWTLPSQLSAADLPLSHEQAMSEHLGQLSALARELAECQALAVHGVFSHADYLRLAGEQPAGAVERALLELVCARVLEGDDHAWSLLHSEHIPLLLAQERPQERARQHAALARMYMENDAPLVYAVAHLMACGQERRAIERLLAHFEQEDKRPGDLAGSYRLPLPAEILSAIYGEALAHADRLGLPPRQLCELRRHVVLLSVVEDEANYWLAAPPLRAQLEADSGLLRYRELDPSLPARERLAQAYSAARAAFERTPQAQRCYAPDEAIRLIVMYVVISIAIAVRTLDTKLTRSLPALLEPFAPFSPVLALMWQNALATHENRCSRKLQARAHWLSIWHELGRITGDELRYVAGIRNAIAFGLSSIDVSAGRLDVEPWLSTLDGDPMQRVNAMYLRKLVALQRGDWEAAELFRKRAELLAIEDRTRQMLTNLPMDLMTHALAFDLSGIKYVTGRIEALAERDRRWQPVANLARARFQLLSGNLPRAREAIELCLRACDPRALGDDAVLDAFCPAAATYVEILDELDQHEQALRWGHEALALLRARQVDVFSWDLERALALVEAKQPALQETARARLSGVLAQQQAAGTSGLRLGLSYEACARLAIQTHERQAVLKNAQLAASAYRHGLGSLLSIRYERLRDEARRAGIELPY